MEKRASKIILSTIMTVCLLLGVFTFTPTPALAAQITGQLDFINDITVSSSGDGWTWDKDQQILSLNGIDLVSSLVSGIELPGGSKIILNGNNKIVNTEGGRGIQIQSGDLAIEGPGSIDITTSGGSGGFSYGIVADNGGGITISNGANIIIDGAAGGIYTYDNSGGVTVNSGAKVTVNKGIDAYSDVIVDSATVDVEGMKSRQGSVTISGSAVVTTGTIEARDDVAISGNAVATTGDIIATLGFTIDGGEVSSTSIFANRAAISGGVVNITGYGYGLYANGDIEISGGSGTIQISNPDPDFAAVSSATGRITIGRGVLVKGWDGSAYTIDVVAGSYTASWGDSYPALVAVANPGVPIANLRFRTDAVAPVLTATAASRTSDANATVKFTSDEGGTYYYQLDGAAGTAAALVAAGTNATTLTAAEQTIALTNLTAGAHTVYVAAKDEAGNIGNLLTIAIRAYTPTTYALTVQNGTGSGSYAAGENVNVVADAAPFGQAFDSWTSSGGGSFANANSAVTTFTMPANAATVTATYKPAATKAQLGYRLAPKTYNGKPQGVKVTPGAGVGGVTVKYNGSKTLPVKAGTYEITADVAAGTQYAAAQGLSLGRFTINKANLAKIKISIADLAWTGRQIKPTKFIYNGISLTASANASVSGYGKNKDIGKGTMKLTGKGNFSGTKTVAFNIVPKTNSVQRIIVGSRQLKVMWKKVSSAQRISKYQLRYRVKGTASWTTKTYASSISSATIRNLKQGKYYEVQARSYKTVSGAKYYSAWSATKTSGKLK